MKKELPIFPLKHWFLGNKRDLPWRETQDPYAIWISEVMLQQTQVSVVIPYFLNWMNRFPTISHLAAASLDEVIKAWEGLGYYSRARHLHQAALYLVERFNGCLPDQEEELNKIKGLGPYTIGAILSFAFHQKKAALDGNVIRVITRYFGLKEDISKPKTVNELRSITQHLLPDEEPWIISEALIELGATICQRKARCIECPIKEGCASFKNGTTEGIPFNSKKIKIESIYRFVAVIQQGDHFLVKRGEKGAIMSDLYEFPYVEVKKGERSADAWMVQMENRYALRIEKTYPLQPVSQGFTRYQAVLYPSLFSCQEMKEVEGLVWLSLTALKQLAFSSGHRRIFQQVVDLPLPA
ncbi:MAG: A/G-specific adenine glycosylase [Parachlamydiaceae bacterium]